MPKLTHSTALNKVMRSPLHAYDLAKRAKKMDASCGVWANEVPLLGYISLRGNSHQPEFLAAVQSALGVNFPTAPCAMQTMANLGGLGSISWISPSEWLIVCPRTQLESLQQTLKTALNGIHSQVVDNSGGYTTVLLQGENATDVLQHCTVYDVHSLKNQHMVGTTFGKMSFYLYRQDGASCEGYGLLIRRSFVDYIWPLLERSAAPYGFGIMNLNT